MSFRTICSRRGWRTLRTLALTLFATTAVVGLTPAADAAPVRVSQESTAGAGDFDANILGFIDPFATTLTATQFYQYDNPNRASYNGELNGGPTPVSDLSQIFLVNASDGLSLFVVHDRPNDGSGGSTQTQWNLTGDTAGPVLGDDPNETITVSAGNTQFNSSKNWIACCTDGYVIGSLESDWELLGQFLSSTGISTWAAVSSDASSIALDLDIGRRVRLDLAPVPLPAAFPLFAGALGLFGFLGWRRRKSAAA